MSAVVSSPLELRNEVTSPTVGQRPELPDSRGDSAMPVSLSSSEAAARPQLSGHDEPLEPSQPERLYYDAAPSRPSVPSHLPGISPAECFVCIWLL